MKANRLRMQRAKHRLLYHEKGGPAVPLDHHCLWPVLRSEELPHEVGPRPLSLAKLPARPLGISAPLPPNINLGRHRSFVILIHCFLVLGLDEAIQTRYHQCEYCCRAPALPALIFNNTTPATNAGSRKQFTTDGLQNCTTSTTFLSPTNTTTCPSLHVSTPTTSYSFVPP